MIHSVLIFNADGVPRLIKFYTAVDVQTQRTLLRQVHSLIHKRTPQECSFITPPKLLEDLDDIKVIYRHYATLYFVFIVDDQESELGILDLIQVFVECLDKCFPNVCELDLVFGWQVLQTVLEEIVQGGMVIDTNISRIVAAVDDANSQRVTGVNGGSSTSRWLSLENGFGWRRP
ncbi:Sigma-adaptin 3A [Candidozyma auris]|uniref:AP complex subunit sigma n=2 Tax=Candidozyma auris TaxID=498019 RepID=A0A2H1A7H3_CANAR|nr:clathrin-associated_protein_AP-3_complex_component_APS3 [[Candida] auris]PIS57242.1 clathrin-associated protein AP-3 complex component APS3 [[Candida] auris]PIS58818.1 clathrin-associated protein AP-3 complex component APS3 [[Candida] auris]PSK78514.1 clathrin-associated protein AP-3 complex component APS3 [[Candida] auris]QEL60149.1 clathrin-associated protein AP-3 complex component APS3 [[Candida] auris]QEO20199.1 clathrin-associated_protein_AP-3_complex_component_APS3 [[Candida] auris]